MAVIRRVVRHPDGREEVFIPHKDQHGRYVMATKQTDDPIQYATNQLFVDSEAEVIEKLRPYVLGWKAYFGLSQTPSVWRKLDEWMRHRLRGIQLKHWKTGATMYRELIALGVAPWVARKVAANSHCWWRNSAKSLNGVLTIAYFDRLNGAFDPDHRGIIRVRLDLVLRA